MEASPNAALMWGAGIMWLLWTIILLRVPKIRGLIFRRPFMKEAKK